MGIGLEKLNSSIYDSDYFKSHAEEPEEDKQDEVVGLHSTSPLSLWIMLMLIAAIAKIIAGEYSTLSYSTTLTSFSNFVLLVPGILLLPLLVGLISGIQIGNASTTLGKARIASLYNGIYGSILYVLVILTVYELIAYFSTSFLPTTSFVIQYWFIQPIIILIVLPMLVATVTFYRKKSAGEIKKTNA